MSSKFITFGEIMLRLSTPNFTRFTQASSFDVVYGGGEANVAVSLANFGLASRNQIGLLFFVSQTTISNIFVDNIYFYKE